MPVNPMESLAPDGLLFIEMCQRDTRFCNLTTSRAANTNFNCYHFWVDEFIHERGAWKGDDGVDGYRKTGCLFNHTLLRELRKKYGIYHEE